MGLKMRKRFFQAIVGLILLSYALICILPIVNLFAISLSGQSAILGGEVALLPIDFQAEAYKNVFSDANYLRSIGVSVFVTALGTTLSVFLTIITAYPLARNDLFGGKAIMKFIIFTMLFNGGMIPLYLVVTELNILNTIWAMILPGAINTFYLIIMRTFFLGIPEEMVEAARIDGCGEIRLLFQMFIPLSTAAIATITLFYAVGYWNSYMGPTLYITDSSLFTMPVRLRQIILADGMMQGSTGGVVESGGAIIEAVKNAYVIVSTVPILLVYPFIQKHFVSGITAGAVKG